jgi:hypothetical protein
MSRWRLLHYAPKGLLEGRNYQWKDSLKIPTPCMIYRDVIGMDMIVI